MWQKQGRNVERYLSVVYLFNFILKIPEIQNTWSNYLCFLFFYQFWFLFSFLFKNYLFPFSFTLWFSIAVSINKSLKGSSYLFILHSTWGKRWDFSQNRRHLNRLFLSFPILHSSFISQPRTRSWMKLLFLFIDFHIAFISFAFPILRFAALPLADPLTQQKKSNKKRKMKNRLRLHILC